MEVLWRLPPTVFLLVGLVSLLGSRVESCNEAVCASIVSKCMLTQSCKCELKNTTCCKECIVCLGKDYYEECCSCVELCPKPNETVNSLLSHVEEFNGIPDLFNVLAFSDDIVYDWHRYSFPINYDNLLSNPSLEKDINFYLKTNEKHLDESEVEVSNAIVNCTVLFLDQCTSWSKCRQICQSTGASSYRWFHDGCCQCVGSLCVNYGLNESRCRQCPETRDELEELIDEDLQDFGEDVGPFSDSINNNY